MPIKFSHKGDFKKTTKFLTYMSKGDYLKNALQQYGQMGVEALAAATPVDTGVTAASWAFKIEVGKGSLSLIWTNSSNNKSISIVYLLVYGHGTGTGGWVEGRDFITPSIQPIMDGLVDKIWREVKSA